MSYKHEIKSINDIDILTRSGRDLICPFQQPMPVQSKLGGGMQFIPVACSSQCPHFNLDKEENTLVISCGSVFQVNDISIETSHLKRI